MMVHSRFSLYKMFEYIRFLVFTGRELYNKFQVDADSGFSQSNVSMNDNNYTLDQVGLLRETHWYHTYLQLHNHASIKYIKYFFKLYLFLKGQYIQLVKVLYCKLQNDAFPYEVRPRFELWSQRWEASVTLLGQCGPYKALILIFNHE